LNVIEKSLYAFPKVVRQQYVGEVGTFIYFCFKFLQDVVCQKLLKSVDFSQSYSKNKRERHFYKT